MAVVQGPILREGRRLFRKWRKKKYKEWKDDKIGNLLPRLRGQSTLFGPRKDTEAAEHIDITTKAGARKSVKWLNSEWNKAKRKGDRDRMRSVKQYAVSAANTAGIIADNPRTSDSVSKEKIAIKNIYKKWYQNKKLP